MESKHEKSSTIRKVAVSSFLGNFIEWFDYATYSYFAIVIANVFFPGDDPALALIQTFAVFALSFLLRPIGAVFWGAMGDKKGRKWALSTSIFLMAGATFCIGLLPGYSLVGFAAPVMLLLLRSKDSYRLEISRLRMHKGMLRRICNIGIPSSFLKAYLFPPP